MQEKQSLIKKLVRIIDSQINEIYARAEKARLFQASLLSPEEKENPDALIQLEERQRDIYESIYAPWINEYEDLKRLLKKSEYFLNLESREKELKRNEITVETKKQLLISEGIRLATKEIKEELKEREKNKKLRMRVPLPPYFNG